MKMRNRQSGISVIGVLVIGVMVGFFTMSALKIMPAYLEYLTVKKIVSGVAAEFEAEAVTIPQLRRKIANMFNTNQVYALSPRDVKVYRKKGKTYIDASYEFRAPLVWRIDAVVKFDDLKYTVGETAAE